MTGSCSHGDTRPGEGAAGTSAVSLLPGARYSAPQLRHHLWVLGAVPGARREMRDTAAMPQPSVPRPQPNRELQSPSRARAGERVGCWGRDNDGSDMWALPGQRSQLMSQNLGHCNKPKVDVSPSFSIAPREPKNFSASLHVWVSSVQTRPPQGGGQRWRRHPVMGPLEGPSKRPHGRRVQGHALPTLRGHERVAGEGAGDSQPAHRVTRPGSQLRFSAPRASSLGPGAGPGSGGWRSQGRRRTGCAGRPRSPLRSARSRHPASAGCGRFL